MKWITPADYNFYGFWGPKNDGLKAVERHLSFLEKRQDKYSNSLIDKGNQYATTLEDRGWVIIPNFFNEEQKRDLLEIKASMKENIKKGNIKHMPGSIISLIRDPLVNVNRLSNILFDERIVEICKAFFDTEPALTSVAARESYIDPHKLQNNQAFHRDYNSLTKHLKIAFYLHDVDMENGPFTYVDKSNQKLPADWTLAHYWRDEDIEHLYGKDSIKYLTAKFGDLIIANTRGFHKGLKPVGKERLAVHACYMIHPELCGPIHDEVCSEDKWLKIKKEDFDKLNENQKPTADFLKIIDK